MDPSVLNPSYHLIYTILIICTVVYMILLPCNKNAKNASFTLLQSVPAATSNELTALYGKFLQLWRLEVCVKGASLARSEASSLLGLQAATFLFCLHMARNMGGQSKLSNLSSL